MDASKISRAMWVLLLLGGVHCARADSDAAARMQMLIEIQRDAAYTGPLLGAESVDPVVLAVLGNVPRHEFVPADSRAAAYENRPLPIGHGQTISQPYIVALMTSLLRTKKTDRVLEIGTGSGYQAAVLAELAAHVYTIEIIHPLGEHAERTLKRLRYDNVSVRIGDGYYGWEEHAPFDGIVVTAAASHVPPPLVQQLKPGGRMVIPVGSRFFVQQLVLVEKAPNGEVHTRQLLPVRFVPLTGGH